MELYEDDPALMLPPMAKQQTLAANVRPSQGKTRLTSIPTQGVLTQPQQDYQQTPIPTPGAAAKPPDYRQIALDRAQQANDAATTMPDMSQQVQRHRQGYEDAGGDIAMGMFLSHMGGRMGRDMGPQVFKNALARRAPEHTPYGTIDYEGGFTADPMKAREFTVSRLETQARLYETMAHNAETVEQRNAAAKAADDTKRELAQMHDQTRRAIAANRGGGGGPLVPVYDPETQLTTYVPRSQAAGMRVPPRAGAGGRQLTPGAVNQISEDEGKVAQFSNLVGTWKPEYGGWGTSVGNVVGNYSPISSEAQRDQAQWWKGYQAFVNEMRHQQFGAALTPTEKAEFTKAIITPETDPRIVNTFLQTQLKLAETARQRRVANLGRAGYDVGGFGGGNQPQPAPPGAPGPRNAPGVSNFPATGAGVVDFSSLK